MLDEALVWACKSNRVKILERLGRAGAQVHADPYRGTPLIWAAARTRSEVATWPLDHGADVNQKGTFGGSTHGQGITALHIAAQNGHMPMVSFWSNAAPIDPSKTISTTNSGKRRRIL